MAAEKFLKINLFSVKVEVYTRLRQATNILLNAAEDVKKPENLLQGAMLLDIIAGLSVWSSRF